MCFEAKLVPHVLFLVETKLLCKIEFVSDKFSLKKLRFKPKSRSNVLDCRVSK